MATEIKGVVLIAVSPRRRILVGQEFRDKPHFGLRAGMESPPMETRLYGEALAVARKRLSNEEVPGVLPPNFSSKLLGKYQVVRGVWVNLYVTKVDTEKLPTMPSYLLEVGNHRWVTLEEALELWLRQGAWEMIRDFAAGRQEVICKRCRQPKGLVGHVRA